MTTKISKKWLLFISILFVIALFIRIYRSAPTYKKSLEFGGHSVEYEQYYFGEEELWEHHYCTNEMLYESAQLKLAFRLFRDFKLKKDPKIEKDIRSYVKKFNLPVSDTLQIDSLIQLFNTNYDSIIYIE